MATASSATAPASSGKTFLVAAMLFAAVALTYSNSLQGPFVFDDIASIPDNPSIRRIASPEIFSPPAGVTVSGRPLVNVSLALNRALGGESVRGYHLANIGIHLSAALVLFGLLRRTFEQPRLRVRFRADATWVAFSGAVIWALHPLQTESVTYVVQRAESLMGLFYFLTLYCFVRGAELPLAGETTGGPKGGGWLGLSFAACLLGMATKEVMASAPIAVLLYDRTFVSGNFVVAWRQHRRFYLTLAGTWLLLAFLAWHAGSRSGTAGFSADVSPWAYALTQAQAIGHYLRLVVWPYPLVFDYGSYAPPVLQEAMPSAILLAVMVGLSLWCLFRRPVMGFAGAFFFLTLAPTSSVLPIVTEPMAEHRLYLPLAAFAALAAVGGHLLVKARGPTVTTVVAVGLGLLTFHRNEVYRTERSLWAATVQVAPKNPRAHYSFALALVASGEFAMAETHFKSALALAPDYVAAHHGLGELFTNQGRLQEAAVEYRSILRIRPDDFVAYNALGGLAFQVGDLPVAAEHFENAVRVKPDSAPAHNNLGAVRCDLGDLPGAKITLETALRLKPDYAEAHYNLGNVLTRQNRLADARESYQRALRLAPDYAEAHAHLGVVLQNLGESPAAIEHYREALRLRPDFEFVKKNLATLLATSPRL